MEKRSDGHRSDYSFNLHRRKETEVTFGDKVEERAVDAAAKTRIARRVYIGAKDIARYGYTGGCPKCEHEMRYGPGRSTANHSEVCRTIMMDEIAKSGEGQDRISRATTRLDKTHF